MSLYVFWFCIYIIGMMRVHAYPLRTKLFCKWLSFVISKCERTDCLVQSTAVIELRNERTAWCKPQRWHAEFEPDLLSRNMSPRPNNWKQGDQQAITAGYGNPFLGGAGHAVPDDGQTVQTHDRAGRPEFDNPANNEGVGGWNQQWHWGHRGYEEHYNCLLYTSDAADE